MGMEPERQHQHPLSTKPSPRAARPQKQWSFHQVLEQKRKTSLPEHAAMGVSPNSRRRLQSHCAPNRLGYLTCLEKEEEEPPRLRIPPHAISINPRLRYSSQSHTLLRPQYSWSPSLASPATSRSTGDMAPGGDPKRRLAEIRQKTLDEEDRAAAESSHLQPSQRLRSVSMATRPMPRIVTPEEEAEEVRPEPRERAASATLAGGVKDKWRKMLGYRLQSISERNIRRQQSSSEEEVLASQPPTVAVLGTSSAEVPRLIQSLKAVSSLRSSGVQSATWVPVEVEHWSRWAESSEAWEALPASLRLVAFSLTDSVSLETALEALGRLGRRRGSQGSAGFAVLVGTGLERLPAKIPHHSPTANLIRVAEKAARRAGVPYFHVSTREPGMCEAQLETLAFLLANSQPPSGLGAKLKARRSRRPSLSCEDLLMFIMKSAIT